MLTDEQFFAFGWRIPFLASAVLVLIGLYVRLTITETPVFRDARQRREQVKVPILVVFRDYPSTLLAGLMLSLATFVLFYLMTVFALSWGTSALGFSRGSFSDPASASFFSRWAFPWARYWPSAAAAAPCFALPSASRFGLTMAPMFAAGHRRLVTMALGLALWD